MNYKYSKTRRTQLIDRLAYKAFYVIAILIVLILAALLIYILVTGLPHISWHFLTGKSKPFQAGGGIGIQLFNSFYLLILTMLISVPISLGAGIWLSEYAKKNRFTNLIRTTIEILSSLPSVVVGLFGFILFVLQFNLGFSLLSGALALTIFSLPLLTTNVENALQTVHFTQREAGLALGLSRIETVLKIVVPAALPNIVTGMILAAGRVFGEAAALIYTAGQSAPAISFSNWNIFDLSSFLSPFRPAETLAVHIWKVNSEGLIPDASSVSAGASAVLIIAVLLFNFIARYLSNRIYQHMTGVKS